MSDAGGRCAAPVSDLYPSSAKPAVSCTVVFHFFLFVRAFCVVILYVFHASRQDAQLLYTITGDHN